MQNVKFGNNIFEIKIIQQNQAKKNSGPIKFPHLGKSSGTWGKLPLGFNTLKINDKPLDHSEVFSLLNNQYPETHKLITIGGIILKLYKQLFY